MNPRVDQDGKDMQAEGGVLLSCVIVHVGSMSEARQCRVERTQGTAAARRSASGRRRARLDEHLSASSTHRQPPALGAYGIGQTPTG